MLSAAKNPRIANITRSTRGFFAALSMTAE